MVIYPAIDILDGKCVRLRQGDYAQETVFSDDPAAVARQWVEQGADRLHLVDLDGARAGKPTNGDVIRRIVETSGVPCQLGGGIRSDADLEAVFAWGVRWAVLGSKAIREPEWVRAVAVGYPGRIVLGIDARDGFAAADGWLDVSRVRAVDLAVALSASPIAAIVYTDIATDGMMAGPNFTALAEMSKAASAPVIASGGVCELAHVEKLIASGTYGCIIGRGLYEGSMRLPEVLALARAQ